VHQLGGRKPIQCAADVIRTKPSSRRQVFETGVWVAHERSPDRFGRVAEAEGLEDSVVVWFPPIRGH
jgi:hypothetical protein